MDHNQSVSAEDATTMTPVQELATPLKLPYTPNPRHPVVLSANDVEFLSHGSKLLDESTIVVSVVARCAQNSTPRVVECYPLRVPATAVEKHDGHAPGGGSVNKWVATSAIPFPNLFWLVSDEDKIRIGRLEHQGFVKVFRQKLLGDPELLKVFEEQQSRFANRRWNLLSDEDQQYCEENGFVERLRDSGVCGLQYAAQVKCLHAHYAHWLATRDNLVGDWVNTALEEGRDKESKREKFKQSQSVDTM